MNAIRWSLPLVLGFIVLVPNLSAQELNGGGWRGKWTDDNAGHEDRLRARFRLTRTGDYRAVFTGKFAQVIPFVFVTRLNVVERTDDHVILSGSSMLPGFGRFTYDAVADSHNFNAHYSSRRWFGDFILNR